MEKDKSIMGIGPKLAAFGLPYLALAIYVTIQFHTAFPVVPKVVPLAVGFVLLAVGIVFYAATVFAFVKGFKQGMLVTTGTFGLCRNPIYASIIIFFIPAAAFLVNSWVLLTASAYLYIVFKIFIREENGALAAKFGEQYADYRKHVNELIPFYRSRA